jgi:hypothetical protein
MLTRQYSHSDKHQEPETKSPPPKAAPPVAVVFFQRPLCSLRSLLLVGEVRGECLPSSSSHVP